MDKDTILEQFNTIETKIESLIAHCKSLEEANTELKQQVSRLETEIKGKSESEGRDSEVKALIRTKIDSLLERLNGITEAEK